MRGSKSRKFYNYISVQDKVISSLTYITMGLVGFLWIIFSYISGRSMSPFAKFNCYQSIVISLIVYVFDIVLNIFLGVLSIIPFIGNFVRNLFEFPIILSFSIIQLIVIIIMIYTTLYSALGKYPEIPWLSRHIKQI